MDEQYRLWCGKWIACQMLSGSDLLAITELGRPPLPDPIFGAGENDCWHLRDPRDRKLLSR